MSQRCPVSAKVETLHTELKRDNRDLQIPKTHSTVFQKNANIIKCQQNVFLFFF